MSLSSFAPKSEKRHAACDECRGRKLKCTGGVPFCERCVAESATCIYSIQKPMGRPRKRKKEFDEDKDSEFENHTIVSLSESYKPSNPPPLGTNVTVQISQQFSHAPQADYDSGHLSAPQPTHYAMLHKQSLVFSGGGGSRGVDPSQTNFMFGVNTLMKSNTGMPQFPHSNLGISGGSKFDSFDENSVPMMVPPPPIHTPLNPRSVNFSSSMQVNVPTSAGSASSARPSPSSSSSSPSIWSPPHRDQNNMRNGITPFHQVNNIVPQNLSNGQFSNNGVTHNPTPVNNPPNNGVRLINQRTPSESSTSPLSNLQAQFPMTMMFSQQVPPTDLNPNCACLSNSYLATSGLHSVTVSFPTSLVPLKKAIITANGILECEACPRQTGSAMQNMFTLATLLMSLVEQARKVLSSIEDEASQVKAMGGTKSIHINEDSINLQYDDFTGEAASMAIPIEATPDEWGRLAKRFVRNQIVGMSDRPQTLVYIVDRLQLRQETWHATKKKTINLLGEFAKCVADENGEYMCLKLVRMIRDMVNVLDC